MTTAKLAERLEAGRRAKPVVGDRRPPVQHAGFQSLGDVSCAIGRAAASGAWRTLDDDRTASGPVAGGGLIATGRAMPSREKAIGAAPREGKREAIVTAVIRAALEAKRELPAEAKASRPVAKLAKAQKDRRAATRGGAGGAG